MSRSNTLVKIAAGGSVSSKFAIYLLLFLIVMTALGIAGSSMYYHYGSIERFTEMHSSNKINAEMIVAGSSSTWMSDHIPYLIHQTAPSNKKKWKQEWLKCQASWKEILPNYKYILWDDDDIDYFIKSRFPKFYKIFSSYPKQIQRADAVRYFILFEYGGIYADMDYMLLKDFTHLIPPGKVSITESPHGNEGLQNALMLSPPKHPFWLYVVQELLDYYYSNRNIHNVLESTGPQIVVRASKKAPAMMFNALPTNQFNPLTLTTATRKGTAKEGLEIRDVIKYKPYTVHMGTCSYC